MEFKVLANQREGFEGRCEIRKSVSGRLLKAFSSEGRHRKRGVRALKGPIGLGAISCRNLFKGCACEGRRLTGPGCEDDFKGLIEAISFGCGVKAKGREERRPKASAEPDDDAASRKVIERSDLLGNVKRMMDREQ